MLPDLTCQPCTRLPPLNRNPISCTWLSVGWKLVKSMKMKSWAPTGLLWPRSNYSRESFQKGQRIPRGVIAPARYWSADLYENAHNINKIQAIPQRTGRAGPKTGNDSAILQRKPLGTMCGCFIYLDFISITPFGPSTCLNRPKMPRYQKNMAG